MINLWAARMMMVHGLRLQTRTISVFLLKTYTPEQSQQDTLIGECDDNR